MKPALDGLATAMVTFLLTPMSIAETRLWRIDPGAIAPSAARGAEPGLRELVAKRVRPLLARAPAPVVTLASAGITRRDDPRLVAARKAFVDTDACALLAAAWRVTGDRQYARAAEALLLAWARTNVPNGNPIDETRLDGFLWGFDLVRSDMSPEEAAEVERWISRIASAGAAWRFGTETSVNNHMTHHLKIQCMIHELLDDRQAIAEDLCKIEAHARVNLLNPDGSSVDFHQRDALHYHVYDLEAWVEIGLVTGCCAEPIDRAYAFFRTWELGPEPHREFIHSTVALDRERSDAGFEYARIGEAYDERKAWRLILSYSTLRPQSRSDVLRVAIDVADLSQRELFAYVRERLWPQR